VVRSRTAGGGAARFAGRLLWAGVLAAGWLAGHPGDGSGVRPAVAQRPPAPTIKVAPVTQAEAASKLAFPIEVGPPEAIAKNSFIRIRGLPPAAALTEGHAIAPGAWAVPLAALPTLAIVLPAGLEGRADVAISLVSVDGLVLAEARTSLRVAAAKAGPGQAAPPAPQARSSVSLGLAAPKLDPAERERALALHAKGMEQLERGNVYAARKFFERAAEAGLAQSAVAVASTFDPDELTKLKVLGLQPDVEAARRWYERARELGAPEAEQRLRRLGAR